MEPPTGEGPHHVTKEHHSSYANKLAHRFVDSDC
jgi:hypothetical protein